MPPALRRIRAEVQMFQEHQHERAATAADWVRRVERLHRKVPSACVEDNGETVRLGELSPGCAACKAGKMDCIFVTTRCNLNCAFCMCPHGMADRFMYSALAGDLPTLFARYARAGIAGVALTGGEPLVDAKGVLNRLSVLRSECASLYIWLETNGTLLSSALIGELAAAGLDEIRFNVAATGYRHPWATRMLYEAARRIPAVAVEAPAIPEHVDLCLDSLQAWSDGGVKYLNLHELVYQSGSNSATYAGDRVSVTMPDGHRCAVNPRSTEVVERVFERVVDRRLPLAVNDCSLRTKAGQIQGRRHMLAPFVLRPHEQLRADGLAESACRFSAGHAEWMHPASLGSRCSPQDGARTVLLRRQLPLAIGHPGQWVHFDLQDECHADS